MNKSIELDSNLPEVHRAFAVMKIWEYDWSGAETEYRKALAFEPGNADYYRRIGYLYRIIGRYEEAIQLAKKSINLDPLSGISYFNFGQLLYYANRFDEAIDIYKKLLEINPEFPRAHIFLGMVYLAQGKIGLAKTEMEYEKNEAWKSFGIMLTNCFLKRKTEVDSMLRDFIARYKIGEMYQIAVIYALNGEVDRSFEYLENSYKNKEPRLSYIKNDPLLKNLENDPRHKAFLKKMNLTID